MIKNISKLSKFSKQGLMIGIVVVVTLILAVIILRDQSSESTEKTDAAKTSSTSSEQAQSSQNQSAQDAHGNDHSQTEKQQLTFTPQQWSEQPLTVEKASLGQVNSSVTLPARITVNTDQQAHVSAGFSGRVDAVYVHSGQQVKRGQPLASLLVPELVDLQSTMQILQSKQALAEDSYQREKQLWQQGISAKQDYLSAQSAYRQAQIEVQAANSRLKAYGAAPNSQGRFTLKSPINGVISNKDLVIGETIQAAQQIFVIDQLNQLWLEFPVPDQLVNGLSVQSMVQVNLPDLMHTSTTAKIMSLTPTADAQTGRLIARAILRNDNLQFRPNMLVNVQVPQTDASKPTLMVDAQSIQNYQQQSVVFVVEHKANQIYVIPRPVRVERFSHDQKQAELLEGLQVGEQYVGQGSFLLKSELEKGEAGHDH